MGFRKDQQGKNRSLLNRLGCGSLLVSFLFFNSAALASDIKTDITQQRYQIDISHQDAEQALKALAKQTGIQLLFPYDLVKTLRTRPLQGQFNVLEALDILLQDTGLHGGLTDSGVITISQTGTNQNGKGKSMNIKHRKSLLATLVGLFAAGGAATATAQDEMQESARAQNVLDEIIVTAEKREASMQDVPITISAFTGDRLEQSGVTETLDLEMVTPGLSFSTDTRAGQVFIRGVGSTTLSGPGADPSASTYIDGVYQGRFVGSLVDILDVERVEVLKGPQGTLYGRNSTGGAIKYISKAPGRDFGGSIKTKVGNYDLRSISVMLDTPLIQDKLLLRSTLLKKDRDGYTEIINSTSDKGNDRDDLAAARFTLQYLPTDDVDVVLHASAVNDDGNVGAQKQFIDPDSGQFTTALMIDDPRKIASELDAAEAPLRSRQIDVQVNLDLGWAKLTSITAYSDGDFKLKSLDVDATELAILRQGRPAVDGEPAIDGTGGDSQALSQELTLASSGQNKLDWTVGAFYLEEETHWITGFDLPTFSFFSSFRAINETTASALFGDATYHITDKLRLNAGVRYSKETKDYAVRNESNGVVGEYAIGEGEWDEWTPKVGLDYSFSDDVMVYFTASKGFKSGAFNLTGGPAVDPEFITAFEIGAKTMWLDSRLRLNASAFSYDYTDLQVQTFDLEALAETINNAAEADIQGLEIAATALLSESFQMDIGLSFLDAEYGEFLRQDSFDPDTILNLEGNKLSQAPKFTASVGIAYSRQIEGLGNLLARLDYYYSDKKYFSELNGDAFQDSYELVNARIGFESQDGAWNISFFGKNLTDELVFASKRFNVAFYGEDGFLTALTPPRTYGVSVDYNF
ncbi:TonB-dependent receptor [Porticoccaceae bacterium]|nr:TonB-dependent receptor [Porticoccaceae bacterium]